jgi:hypothetical protein
MEFTQMNQDLKAKDQDIWTNIATAGRYNIWAARESEFTAKNIYQVTDKSSPDAPKLGPSAETGGYRNLDVLLDIKGVSGQLEKNKFFPEKSWICASKYSKLCNEGAIFEKTIGSIEDGLAPYDMTICVVERESGEMIIPIHGTVHMLPAETVETAGKMLQQYWDDLPMSHKRIYIAPVTPEIKEKERA